MGVGRLRRTNKRYLAACARGAHACRLGPGAPMCAAPLGEEASAAASRPPAAVRLQDLLFNTRISA